MAKRTRRPARAGSSLPKGELGETLSHVKTQYGKNTVNIARDIPQPPRISTGSFILDFALLGGFPEGRGSMVVGERHGGKSMLAMKVAAAAQAMYPDQTPVYIDVERTFDATWARKLGVDTSSMPVIECDSGEMAVDVTEATIASAESSLVIVDSIAAITPMREIDDSAGDQHVGLQARLVAKMIRKTTSALTKERLRDHRVTLLFVNQFRSKIGVTYGDPRSIPGGKALEYCTSVQVIMKNKENKGKDDMAVEAIEMNEHAFTITKNKMNNGPRSGEFNLIRVGEDEGKIDDSKTVLAYAKKFGIYSGGGTRWKLEVGENETVTFGKAEEAVRALRGDPEMYWRLRNRIISLQAVKLDMPAAFIKGIGK